MTTTRALRIASEVADTACTMSGLLALFVIIADRYLGMAGIADAFLVPLLFALGAAAFVSLAATGAAEVVKHRAAKREAA